MSTVAPGRTHTPEDLLRMPDGDRYELVGGQLVELPASFLSSYVAGNVFHLLSNHCEKKRSGWVAPEGASYQCFPHAPAMVRKPDTSFIRLDRLTAAQATEEGHMTVAPDLAVEVISPNEEVYEVDQKLADYFAAGVPMVWVVNPVACLVRADRPGKPILKLHEADELSGEEIVPGFRCRVSELFRLPTDP